MVNRAEKFANSKMDKYNIYPRSTEAQEGLDILIEHFLGKDWYVVDPLPQKQVNTVAVYQILSVYEKKSLWQRVKSIF